MATTDCTPELSALTDAELEELRASIDREMHWREEEIEPEFLPF